MDLSQLGNISREITLQLVLTGLLVVAYLISRSWAQAVLERFARKQKFRSHRLVYSHKLLRILVTIFFIGCLGALWGVPLKNIWVVVTSVVGIIAIAFFAVWSILSNVVAGLLIFLLEPFQIGDKIQVLIDEHFGGEIRDINLMFVEVIDPEGGLLRIPNNLFFQKVIRIQPKAD